MDDDREHRIRNRAYELWESDGRPEGEQDRHWFQAIDELGLSDPVTGAPLDDRPLDAVDQPANEDLQPVPLPPPV